jgi:hypothetical protein
VEDALGYKFLVPSEYDFSLLQVIIQHRFQEDGEVGALVHKGDYELSYANNSDQILCATGRMKPGSHVVMAIILENGVANRNICPLPRCASKDIDSATGGGYKWYVFKRDPMYTCLT